MSTACARRLYDSRTSQNVAESGVDELPAEWQSVIEESIDEQHKFSPDELEFFGSLGRMERVAGEVGEVELDFGAEGTGHGSFDQADDGSVEERSGARPVTRGPESDADLGVVTHRADALPERTQFGQEGAFDTKARIVDNSRRTIVGSTTYESAS